MTEVLPYMNIFPDTDVSLDKEISEGINNAIEESGESVESTESKVYANDEVVPNDGNNGYGESIPQSSNGENNTENTDTTELDTNLEQ